MLLLLLNMLLLLLHQVVHTNSCVHPPGVAVQHSLGTL
jgi:hypothetical protein